MIIGFLGGEACQALCTRTLLYASVLMLSGVNFGFNMAYSVPAVHSMQADFPSITGSDTRWKYFTVSTSAFAIAGPLISGLFLKCVGRRTLSFVYAVFSMLAWLLFQLTSENHFFVAILARALSGLLTGASSALTPLYLVELSRRESTGFFGTLYQLGIALGWFLCYTIAIPLSDWRVLAGIAAGICALLAIFVLFIPESPELAEPDEEQHSLLAPRWLWWLFVSGLLMLFQQTTGVNVVLMSLRHFFEGQGNQTDFQLFASSLSSLAQVVACLLGAFLIEHIGRRIIWVASLTGIGIVDLLYALSRPGIKAFPDWAVVIIIFVFEFCFGLGAGPVPWFFVPEIFPLNLRSSAMAIIATLNWVFAFFLIELREGIREGDTDKMNTWQWFTAFSITSFGGAVFGHYFVRNPEEGAKKSQVLYPEIYEAMID
jgi:MFS family permease